MPTLKFQNFMVQRKVYTEEVIDNLDMFQYIFGKIDKFGWSYSEIISADAGS